MMSAAAARINDALDNGDFCEFYCAGAHHIRGTFVRSEMVGLVEIVVVHVDGHHVMIPISKIICFGKKDMQ